MTERRRLIAATRNEAKIAELARAAAGLATVEPAPQDISLEDLETDGTEAGADAGFVAIAAEKARAVSAAIGGGELVVATDGGLLIPALGDAWQPTRTRRFAGAVSDVDRARALLALAAGLTGEERKIGWREALVVARNGDAIGQWVAESTPGLLATEVDAEVIERGGGFWIPAIWLCPELGGRRLADLTEVEHEARNDHWSRLGLELRRYLSAL